MAVTFVRKTEGNSTSDTLTLNIQSSGTDRVLVVGLAYKSNSVLAPTSIVFNGTESFTLERTAADGGDAQCFLYYLTNPTVTTADVVITMPEEVRMVGYVALFTGVDQTNPFTANTVEAQGTNTAPTLWVTSDTDEICIDILVQVSAGPDTINANGGTLICNGAATGGGTDTRGGGQYEIGAASRQMWYTMSDADNWNIIAGALQEPSAAPQIVEPPPVTATSAIQGPSAGGTGSAPVTSSPVAAPSAVQAPSVSGSGSAPITPAPVAAPSSVQAPSIGGTGSAPVSPAPVAAGSSVQAPSVSGSGSAPVSPNPVQAVSAVQAPSISGSGSAPITLSPVVATAVVRAPEVSTPSGQSVDPSPLPVPTAIQMPVVGGTGSAPVILVAIGAPSAVQAPVLSATGEAPVQPSPVAVLSAVQAPALSGSGSATIDIPSVEAIAQVAAPSVSTPGGYQGYSTIVN